jgi:hypothetical protein
MEDRRELRKDNPRRGTKPETQNLLMKMPQQGKNWLNVVKTNIAV